MTMATDPEEQSVMSSAAVLMATVDTLPEPYQVLGLVDAAMAASTGIVPVANLMMTLADKAAAVGADAVIGIRLSQLTLPTASRTRVTGRVTEHVQNTVVAVALGTAVSRDQSREIE